MGMAGSLSLPRPIPLEVLEAEGQRQGFDGEGLEDFVEIVRQIDHEFIEITVKDALQSAKSSLARAKKR